MSSQFDIGPYDPCPCGSGRKYKFCCAARAGANRRGKFPVGTIVLYGPDDKVTTKLAAAVILREGERPAKLERWVGTGVLGDPKVIEEIRRFFAGHGVKNVIITDGNLGCPHEEGDDFPRGRDCPFCPFWAGKQGTARRDEIDDWDEDDPDAEEDDADDDEDEDEDESEVDAEEDDGEEAFARAESILGGRDLDTDESLDVMLAHLRANLVLPSEVTGTEDFRWEEPYALGGWSPAEYRRLKKTQPSYTDRYQLLSIDRSQRSEWMLFWEDIAARVRRISDGKMFVLGLAELEATDKGSPNYRLLRDYSVWFVNSR